ncbi:FecCD family ABC transporter permease [Flavisphingomonas formosensis]|uniref:FecCD family ABC transporter permease n=1 Tax=Flavisphingomonas formosensis TaxID=861534 RepID=UPI0012F70C3F|nr:iron ABC transporter permease [Sphingomonas formosensis]
MPRVWFVAIIIALLFAAGASLLLPFEGLPRLIASDPSLATTIAIEIRLPRTALALFYGAMLGGAGAAIQALFANPLASPDITGASGGAALGAVVTGYLFGFAGPFGLATGGVIGALLALVLLLSLAGSHAETATLLLAGIAISAVTSALTTLSLALAPSPFAFYDAYDWLMGSLVDRSRNQALFAIAPILLSLILLRRDARALDTLALGEEAAASMGYDLRTLQRRVIVTVAVGIGASVAICGAVGFIGLVAPVFARRLTRGHPGRAIGPAALIGALLLTTADLLVRAAPEGRILPIGVVTAMLGAPFFLWLVARMRWDIRS